MPTGLIGGNKGADELSREEVSSRLEEIFSSSLEGEELDKAVSSIPKRLDKFEGKWDGLIKWAEQKYGENESTDEEAAEEEAAEENQADTPPDDKPAKKGGFFSKFGRGKSKQGEEKISDEGEDKAQLENGDDGAGEISREQATSKLEDIFNSGLEGEELAKAIESIPTRLDKFEGKWPKLIIWAESKYPPLSVSDHSETPIEELSGDGEPSVEAIISMIDSGDLVSALSNLKMMILSDSDNPEVWIAMSSYLSSIGLSGRSKACQEKADSLAA
ncbi:MAG: hypothetical protein CMB61_02740 [Euryarchaeota archaeon]|nr:hypothetical protein [Euryarchaeota archaeon]